MLISASDPEWFFSEINISFKNSNYWNSSDNIFIFYLGFEMSLFHFLEFTHLCHMISIGGSLDHGPKFGYFLCD